MSDTTIVTLAHFGLMLLVAMAVVALMGGTRPGRRLLAWIDEVLL